MTRTCIPALRLLVTVLCWLAGVLPAWASELDRPNILLVIADDFGVDVTSDMYPGLVDELSALYGPDGYNHPQASLIDGHQASTPNLNTFAQQGMRFGNVWAHPFCSPTRASILTGLYGTGTGVLTYADPLSNKHTSFVQLLKDAGYHTGLFGKWHLSGLPGLNGQPDFPGMKPKEAGFDIFQGSLHAAIPLYWQYPYLSQNESTSATAWHEADAPLRSLPGIGPSRYAPVVKVADTIDWIRRQENEHPDTPWFAWLAFNLSHATANQQPSAMAVPDADTLDAPSLAEMQACGGEFGSNRTGNCSGEALMRAMTNSMDTVLGRLFDFLEGVDPNTYVIFVGDNGTPMYARPNLDFIDNLYISRVGRGKGTAYEGGARVPMVIRGPGIAPGSESRDFLQTADLFATTLALAGLEVPVTVPDADGTGQLPLEARDLGPLLFGQAESVRDPALGYVLNENINLMTGSTKIVGARNATHKLICVDGTSPAECEFYNVAADPLEQYPLAEPADCATYDSSTISVASEAWQYCRLSEVIKTRSFFSTL